MASNLATALRGVLTVGTVVGLIAACGSDGGSSFIGGGAAEDGGGPPPGTLGGGPTADAGAFGPSCKPRTCAEQGIECGPAGDGCGGLIQDCGKCGAGLRCGGPNALSKCVSPNIGTACVPKTCADLGVECGLAGDGCGGTLTCPTCPADKQCGANGAPSKCVTIVPASLDGGACVPKTCVDYRNENKDCGTQSDGCGGTVECGGCTGPGEFCGGGGPSKCAVSGGGTCTAVGCEAHPGKCGPQPNGCGGLTPSCGGCTLPEVCGGGGVPSVCGGGTLQNADGGGACTPLTACAPGQCGKIADGCGDVIDCGATCTGGNICGGGGVANVCGKPACTPLTACPAGMNCGSIANGCGGTVTCGAPNACTAPAICGGGGQPNVCGGGTVQGPGGGNCTPKTCAETGKNCGPVADGCGGLVQCPATCPSPEVCGGGGETSICGGGNQCSPRTTADCATLGFNCGFIADGCGGTVQCGATCANGGVCGGGTPNVCSNTPGGGACTGLCLDQPTDCAGGSNTTTITGTIRMPNQTLPVYDALVFVPNGTVDPVPTGIASCDTCTAQVSGTPLISARTNHAGVFTLPNMPHRAGGVPVVIQKGRWRKQITVATTRCGTKPLTVAEASFGTTQSATNNIPRMAVTSGQYDRLQCLIRKMGVADTEFTQPADTGRVHLYHGSLGTSRFEDRFNGYRNAARNLTDETALYGDTARMLGYDAVVLSCNGGGEDRQTAAGDANWTPSSGLSSYRPNVQAFADGGGKIFASHWHHAWLEYGALPWGNTPGNRLAEISHQRDLANPISANINTTLPKGAALADWLGAANGGARQSALSIIQAQHTINTVDTTRANLYISIPGPVTNDNGTTDNDPSVQYFDFNTPVPLQGQTAGTQCGRFVVSDLHVSVGSPNSGSNTGDFPGSNCGTNLTMTDQEKVLAFMLFDLTSCVQQVTPPTCTAKTCANYPVGTCGEQADGCGGKTVNCGSCPDGQICGGGGTSLCGGGTCTAKTCTDLKADCGIVPDGCGNTIPCPNCAGTTTCGGGGVPYKCGTPACTPRSCEAQGIECGQTGDGCGNLQTCKTCPDGTTCGGGGVPNKCGKPACTPLAMCPNGKNCGFAPDGCGGSIPCGDCAPGETCGGGGSPNVCGMASCSPKNCEMQGAQCGSVSDQCGGVAICAQCPAGDFCNGQNLCVSPTCTPKKCPELGVECGPTADTCGGIVQCGGCPEGLACGAAGIPGKCGKNVCTPKTCADLSAVCGQVADGCGGLTPPCGDCQGTLSCKNGACVQACTPRTCVEAGAQCGVIADGCGSTMDCGLCAPGQTCGFNNKANLCGSDGPK